MYTQREYIIRINAESISLIHNATFETTKHI